ncbi:Uncharacterized protein FWK35_00024203 [Aphis craccivora]|uniref:Uncharacterized protein n=1 Tax=Aphis craccivora TaxID=307492 RepID=A0A6G0XZG4_APHCR|nr:Uncharacterized protein FWK35_00024203 [Aphis craccivora]
MYVDLLLWANIPYGTLHNRYHGKHTKGIGGQIVFSNEEEKVMINAVIKCVDWGYSLTLMDLRIVAKSYLDSKGVIVQVFGADNLTGDDWARSLLKRHKLLIKD